MRVATRVGLWLSLVLGLCQAAVAQAQTWSLDRQRPSLFEIIAVDATGEVAWSYGEEDLGGDGAQTRSAEETAIDVRSVYADARSDRLWLRAYVASKTALSASTLLFFFIDSDTRSSTGGAASGEQLGVELAADPSAGGYERVLGVRGDGTLIGVFFWDAAKKQWVEQPERPQLAAAEAGVTRDPLRFAGDDHAYLQVDVGLNTAGLDAACGGAIFVRAWYDAPGKRSFGDDVGLGPAPCRARLNGFGDPELLGTASCGSDAACPAQGKCREGICVFGYECRADAACRTGEKCNAEVCVRVVDRSCSDSANCEGLVCSGGRCIACSNGGAAACASGRVCSPSGRCLAPGSAGPTVSDAPDGPKVRGGAFTCAAAPAADGGKCWALVLLAVAAWCARKRRDGES